MLRTQPLPISVVSRAGRLHGVVTAPSAPMWSPPHSQKSMRTKLTDCQSVTLNLHQMVHRMVTCGIDDTWLPSLWWWHCEFIDILSSRLQQSIIMARPSSLNDISLENWYICDRIPFHPCNSVQSSISQTRNRNNEPSSPCWMTPRSSCFFVSIKDCFIIDPILSSRVKITASRDVGFRGIGLVGSGSRHHSAASCFSTNLTYSRVGYA